jgi:hypothetical protein
MPALFLLPILLTAEDPSDTVKLRYLRPEGGKWVLESELTLQRRKDGRFYRSKTVRGKETMTLTVERDASEGLVKAEVVHDMNGTVTTATVTPHEGKLRFKRGAFNEDFDLKDSVFFTTAPDWSDVVALVSLYDRKKGGKQEYPGMWVHPLRGALTPRYSIERVGEDQIKVDGVEQTLGRYKIRLRASTNTVWAFASNRICKILPDGEKATPIVLEGYEEATKGLK